VPFKRRFDFKKADWNRFFAKIDASVTRIDPDPKRYDEFLDIVRTMSRETIPRGCRSNYILGLYQANKNKLSRYNDKYGADPFSEETLNVGEDLLQDITSSRRSAWHNLMETIDMRHSSKKVWAMIKKLSGDPRMPV